MHLAMLPLLSERISSKRRKHDRAIRKMELLLSYIRRKTEIVDALDPLDPLLRLCNKRIGLAGDHTAGTAWDYFGLPALTAPYKAILHQYGQGLAKRVAAHTILLRKHILAGKYPGFIIEPADDIRI